MYRSFFVLSLGLILSIAASGQSIGLKTWFTVSAPPQVYEGDHFELFVFTLPYADAVWYQYPEEFLLTNGSFTTPEFYAAEEGWWPIIIHAKINGKYRSEKVWIEVIEP